MNKKILFLGFGKMGGAIAQNFLKLGVKKEHILAIDPYNKEADFSDISQINTQNYQADVIIFAIKPQNSEKIIENFKNSNLFHQNSIFISILAGKNTRFFEDILGNDKKIIRLMPNLPILINEGICGYFCNKNLKNGEEKAIIDLFGTNLKVDDENLIHQITAISGSGPAYLFQFAKSIITAGQEIGLSQADSKKLTLKTILGAAKMLENEENIDQLINNVTSKGGTTSAALAEFNSEPNSLSNLTKNAINAALNRSKEL